MASIINNKRVFKNTMFLYIRMGAVMLISLYTSRIVLKELGIEDFGIYNIVGGVVTLFSFLNNTLVVTIRRFMSVEMGRGGDEGIKDVYRASVTSMLLVSAFVVLLLETVGLWFVNEKLTIPDGRIWAANIVYQFSLLSFVASMLLIPFSSLIVTFEKMGIYAYLSIFDVCMKLAFVLFLSVTSSDKLIVWAVLMLIAVFTNFTVHYYYCEHYIIHVENWFLVKRQKIRELFSFSGWSVLGGIAWILSLQGVNIICNLFWGVVLNAAIGISQQVTGAVNQFIANFQTAYQPQLTKNYAVERLSATTLAFVITTSRITFLLLTMLLFPLMTNLDELLSVWLVEVPANAYPFSMIALVCLAVDGMAGPLYLLVYANGSIKRYQIVLSVIQLLYVLLFIVMCELGFSAVEAMSINIVSYCLMYLARLYILRDLMGFPVGEYMLSVFKTAVLPVIVLCAGVTVVHLIVIEGTVPQLILRLSVALICASVAGLLYSRRHERQLVLNVIRKKLC